MKKIISTLLMLTCFFWFDALQASEGGYPLEDIQVDASDHASLQRGVALFQNYCSGCHAMQFQRYARVAKDIGIPEDLMMNNLVFDKTAKIGNLMVNSMTEKDAKIWFGVVPPDLTLVARVRSPEWVYTYLKSFYKDDSRPWGVNNKVFPGVAMPNVVLSLQGMQIDTCSGSDEGAIDPLTGNKLCGLRVGENHKGSMMPDEFDQAMYDITNFLAYSADPVKTRRQELGVYVLLFLCFFFVVAYLLKKEYWKDVN